MEYPRDNVFTFLFSTYKRTAGIAFTAILILAVPVTIALISSQQDIRQRAARETTVQTVDGTVRTITADYDGNVNSSSSCTDGAGDIWIEGSRTDRAYMRFSLSSIPAGATISRVQLQYSVLSSSGPDTSSISPYNNNGQANPQTDSCSTRRSRSKPATTYISNTNLFGSSGQKTVDLPGQAITDIKNAISGGKFSLALNEGSDSGNVGKIASLESASPPKLIITYTFEQTATPTPTASGSTGTVTASPTPQSNATATLTPTTPPLNLSQSTFDFDDNGRIEEVDLNILYAGFRSREGD